MELLSQLSTDLEGTAAQPLQNTAAYTFHFYKDHYIIEANQRALKVQKCLNIDRQTGKITEQVKGTMKKADKTLNFSCLLGTITILDKVFLMISQDVSHVCEIEKNDIFQVQTISFIPYEQESEIYSSSKAQQITAIIGNLRKLVMMGFYFSYTYDLTLSRVRQAIGQSRDNRYVWNLHLMKVFQQNNIDQKWVTILVQGFISSYECYVAGKKLDFYLISRRQSRRAGTRYNSRGIDDDGNVSNHCESEQIIIYDTFLTSYLEVRGSVPIFWSQRGYLTETKISRSKDLTQKAFLKHVDQLTEDYSRIICINLMAKHKSAEQLITENFEHQIQAAHLENLRYEWFDFHVECKHSQFHLSNPLIRKLHAQNKNFGFYLEDLKDKKVLQIQRGVFRTNCLDCLDRTNFVQTKLAMDSLDLQMKTLGVDLTAILKQPPLEAMDEENDKIDNPLIKNFKNIWADNGDMLSAHYTGTGSTHTNITRTGRRDFSGMLDHGKKSLLRFYMQNFADNEKQEAIDILLGTHTDTLNVFTVNIEKELKAREKEFTDTNQVSVLLVTWNVFDITPTNSMDLRQQLLESANKESADIVVFAIQEMVSSNAKTVVIGSDSVAKVWQAIFLDNLRQKQKYILIKAKELLGLALFVYAKDSMKDRIARISYDTIKLGFMGQIGNKGAVVIKMMVDDSLFCFSNAHFEHGPNSLSSRLLNFQDLHSQAFNTIHIGKKKEEKIEQADYRFLLGDLNFRIDLPASDVVNHLQKYQQYKQQSKDAAAEEIMKYLLSQDELNKVRKKTPLLQNYKEASINFFPTYKYERYSDLYDQQRTPSWTDRILLWAPDGYKSEQLSYSRHEINFSDHRPVSAYFKLQTKVENPNLKEQILKSIIAQDQGLITALDDKQILEAAEDDEV